MTTKDLPSRTAEMCSYSLASIAYPWGTDVGAMKIEMDAILNCLGHGKVEVIWGGIAPASALAPGEAGGWNAALAMVVRKAGTNDYIAVVRGTNPLSWDSWKLEDFDVCEKVPWNKADPGRGSISKATATALSIHLGLADGGTSLLDFLHGIAVGDSQATISFAGHSLGGCMAPVLALKFAEMPGVDRSRVSVYAYAGPTPGDSAFAAYMTSVFGKLAVVSFVRDAEDVVPHAWNKDDLDCAKALYPRRPATEAVLALIGYVESRVSANDYRHAYPGFIPILSEVALKDGITQAFGEGGPDSLAADSAGLRTGAWLKRELPRTGVLEEARILPDFLDTLAWFLRAMSMHVLPYLALCLPGAQDILFERVLKPSYFKGHIAAPGL